MSIYALTREQNVKALANTNTTYEWACLHVEMHRAWKRAKEKPLRWLNMACLNIIVHSLYLLGRGWNVTVLRQRIQKNLKNRRTRSTAGTNRDVCTGRAPSPTCCRGNKESHWFTRAQQDNTMIPFRNTGWQRGAESHQCSLGTRVQRRGQTEGRKVNKLGWTVLNASILQLRTT